MLLAAPSFVGGGEEACAQVSQAVPRLVVGIAIDQLRTDYLETFAPLYGEDGLKRLMREGVVYTSAQYASAGVDRASAVASLYTGTVPYSHGIVGEDWMDRQTLRPVHCVDDFKQRGVNTQETTSPQHLLVSTLGDELKVATDGRALVYSVAPSREAAVLSAVDIEGIVSATEARIDKILSGDTTATVLQSRWVVAETLHIQQDFYFGPDNNPWHIGPINVTIGGTQYTLLGAV